MGGTDPGRHVVVPVELLDGERRLYDLARTGTPLAEIGVRLGLPVAEVDRRLDLLVARLGLPDRLALRVPPSDPVIVGTQEEDVAAPSPDGERAQARRRLSRRSLLIGASAVGLAGLGGATALLVVGKSSDGGPSTPGSSPTPRPGSSPTPSATSVPGDALDLIEPVEGGYERRSFAPGEEIPWKHGIFFMDTDSGRIDAYRLAQRLEDELLFTYRLPGPRYIEMLTPDQATRILVDRDTGEAWKYAAQQLRLAGVKPQAVSNERLLFEELDGLQGAPAPSTGRYIVVNEGLGELARFQVSPMRFPPDPLLSAGAGRAVAVALAGESYSLRLFGLDDGRDLANLPLPVPGGRQLSVRWIEESPVWGGMSSRWS